MVLNLSEFSRINTKEVFFILIGFMIGTFSWELCKSLAISNKEKNFEVKTIKHTQSLYNNELSDKVSEGMKILCMIMTNPSNHKTKAIHVKETWGKRCKKLLFITTQEDPDLDTVVVNVVESRQALEEKTKVMWLHAHEHYLDEFDWFMRADDDKQVKKYMFTVVA